MSWAVSPLARVTFALSAALAFAACGGAAPGLHGTSGVKAQAAQQAIDPRTGDPTAATPAAATAPRGKAPAAAPSGAASAPASAPAPAPAPGAAPATTTTTAATAGTAAADDAPFVEPKQIGARHVLIQWLGSERAGKSVLRTKDQALAVAEDVLKRARAGADVGRLAVEYSDEPNAGMRGGSLGRFGKGQMVPAFEQAAFKLKVGEISGIVESPFGFHIIQRTE